MSMGQAEEENHWPGYVDALTTMTMMLIFVMTILAVAIFGLSQNVSRSMVEKIAKAVKIENIDHNETTDRLAERVMAQIESQAGGNTMVAKADPPAIDGTQAGQNFMSSQPAATNAPIEQAVVQKSTAFITVSFQKRATGIDPQTNEKIKSAMAEGEHMKGSIELKAYAEKVGPVSDSRRIAFYRLLNVRTQLIAMGIPPDRIKAKIEDSLDKDTGDLVRIDLAHAG
jgi:Na+-transporting methylmalonyl-CoA/oxaloacetate decarboxylase gamma subunit